jgi:tRNA modification GTPase
VHGAGGHRDQAVLTYFQRPHSYTGEDVVEISAHGSPLLLRSIVERAVGAGARLAEPGEFTFRAYLNGRIDLVQAEAVRDLIDAVTPLQSRAAFDQLEGTLTGRIREIDAALLDLSARLEASLDFPDEGYHFVERSGASGELHGLIGLIDDLVRDGARGRLVREGAQVVIVGRPNSGKSSLFNQLAGAGRAIVTAIPGTTRDLVTEVVDVAGLPVTLVDTAGIRENAADVVEAEGIARTHGARSVADLAVVVLDRSQPLTAEDEHVLEVTRPAGRIVVANKSDLPPAWWDDSTGGATLVNASARTGDGMDDVRQAIAAELSRTDGSRADAPRETPLITNVRHAALLGRARAALARAAEAVAANTPEEFVSIDITEARAALEEVTGLRTPDDVLRHIFERFCIGK